ncbi:surface lipoprotein [Acidovorax sp. CF316]|uniref:MlaA family lipoprotein n=1 Tax=Acidovorax sp. CF316 TaxID=1144317 RepID=UPI00026BEDEE|nr:VacJ family lipoprotein [Acidovorax sp. CF316]EJE49779.1 surface lipoprotein [Acidovorax sp. CF316]
MPHLLSRPLLSSRTGLAMLALITAALSTGCATTAHSQDPLEPVNRTVFSLNDGLDRAVFQPTAKAYQKVVPPVVQTGVSNFFANLQTPWSSANLLFQGRAREGASTIARFGINTTVGVLGVVDVATGWGMPQRSEDFGLTLDTWGVGSGPYVVLPIFGPSNVRDVLSLPVDSLGSLQASDVAVRNSLTALKMASKRADLLEMTRMLDQAALDKYAMVRDAHLKRRNRSAAPTETQGALPAEDPADGERLVR